MVSIVARWALCTTELERLAQPLPWWSLSSATQGISLSLSLFLLFFQLKCGFFVMLFLLKILHLPLIPSS